MADIELKYLTDLASATSAEMGDLLHINQSGNDRSITVQSLAAAIANAVYTPGITIWFNSNANPNALFPGMVWARLPGAGRTIRIANSSGSDVGQTGGSDTVNIEIENLPAHDHSFSAETDSYDYGTKNSNTTGNHSHTYPFADFNDGEGKRMYGRGNGNTTVSVSTSGNHSHTTAIGAHNHNVNGTTDKSGSGSALIITNQYVKQAAWYRVS
jgi:microcystin-dependent protein